MRLQETIPIAIAVFREYAAQDDEAMFYLLQEAGLDEPTASAMLQWIPIAVTRFAMRGRGVRFSDDYHMLGEDGTLGPPLSLQQNPVFATVLTYCEGLPDSAKSQPDLEHIAARSASWKAIRQMLDQGIEPSEILASAPILVARTF